jgi:hypothetical protein
MTKINSYLIILLLLLLNSKISLSQNFLEGVNVDSLVKNRAYAIQNINRIQNNIKLIEELLKYEGNFNTNRSWSVSTYQDSVGNMYAGEYRGDQRISHELVAIFLIEGIIQENILFDKYHFTVQILNPKDEFDSKVLYPYKKDVHMYYDNGDIFEKTLINQKHIKRIFSYYKKWFNKIKKKYKTIDSSSTKHPLKNTIYIWN